MPSTWTPAHEESYTPLFSAYEQDFDHIGSDHASDNGPYRRASDMAPDTTTRGLDEDLFSDDEDSDLDLAEDDFMKANTGTVLQGLSPRPIESTPASAAAAEPSSSNATVQAAVAATGAKHSITRSFSPPESRYDDNAVDEEDERKRRRRSTRGQPASSRRSSYELYTPDEARRVRRKLDTRLVLFLSLLYALSFLDRSNIGNASLAGLKVDLALSDAQYTWLLRAFYVSYVAFEWMTLLYRVFPAHAYISLCVGAWGLVASMQALTGSFAALFVCRFLLGVAEAAFGPGVPFYLSFFYRREELAYRVGMFVAAAPLASCFASSLAWVIVQIGDRTHIASWRLLFLVEGFPSVVVAVWAWVWVPDGPGRVRWLSARETRVAVLRLKGDSAESGREKGDLQGATGRKGGLEWREIRKTLADPKSYLTAGIFFSLNVAFSSMPVFEPTIIKAMGYSTVMSQGLSAIPHFVAFLAVLLIAFLSDRLRTRALFIVVVGLSSMLGYIVLALAPSLGLRPATRYLCLFPITAGFFSAVTLIIVWTMDNQHGDTAKGTGVVILNVIGQMGPMVGTGLYPKGDGPDFVKGHVVCACFMAAMASLALVLRVVLKRANERKSRQNAIMVDRDGIELATVDAESTLWTTEHARSHPAYIL